MFASMPRVSWNDLVHLIRRSVRGDIAGLALLFITLIGISNIFIETILVSGLIILGAGTGFFSLAFKSDKCNVMSAACANQLQQCKRKPKSTVSAAPVTEYASNVRRNRT
jgi:uncharacterized membrane protein